MKFKFSHILFISLLLLSYKVSAENGYLPHGLASQGSTGGAGAALPIEANNTYSNPALIGQLDNHLAFFGGTDYYNKASLNTAPAPGGNKIAKQQSDILRYYPYGLFGFVWRLSANWTFGYGSASGGGDLTKFDRSIDASNSTFNRRIIQITALANPTIAYTVSCNQSYGLSLILGASAFKTDLARSTFPFAETSAHNRYSYTLGIGARIGGFWGLTDWLNMGASMSTPVWFQRNTKYRDVLKHPLNVPAIARLGFDFHIQDCTHFLVDFQEILWHEVKALGKDLGWKNQFVVMVGIRQHLTDKLIGCIGYNYGRSPIRRNNVFINGLGLFITEHHLTGGFQYNFNDWLEFFLHGARYFPHRLVDNGKGVLGPIAKGAIGRLAGWNGTIGLVVKL